MKVMTIMGTRPEMIKMWSVLKKLDSLNFDHIMVHTNQNFTKELKDFFFRDLELRPPDYNLDIDTTSYGKEVADVIRKKRRAVQESQTGRIDRAGGHVQRTVGFAGSPSRD